MRLADTIARWLGRVEVVLTGADLALREGEAALDRGHFMAARAAARSILNRLPGNPVGLALLADACEQGGLHAELAQVLEELAPLAGSRADVWCRLAKARGHVGADAESVRDAYLRALAVAEPGDDARTDALLALADLDLEMGDGARAEVWLARIALGVGGPGATLANDVATRSAAARLARGDAAGALRIFEGTELAPDAARGAAIRGEALAKQGDPGAFPYLLRALVLDNPRAGDALASALAAVAADADTRTRIHAVLQARGEVSAPRWRAAFARAAGDHAGARKALTEAVRAGDPAAARFLLEAALADRDTEALGRSLEALGEGENDRTLDDARRLYEALTRENLEPLMTLTVTATEPLRGWAEARLRAVRDGWLPRDRPAEWSALLARLDLHARALEDLDAVAALGDLASERARPLRLAITGEFNAGKSTLINALIGEDVAPTGVLPTTATLHHLRYGLDPLARLVLVAHGDAPSRERVVPLADLRRVLKTLEPSRIARVDIELPLPFLTRIEVLDTPGFNAPDASHTEAATRALDHADVVFWVLDAAQPLKQSERRVLDAVKSARVPLQVLVNKIDRVPPSERARIMTMISEGLRDAGVTSWTPPLALSARQALRARTSPEANREALTESGWPALESLLTQAFVERREALKERALRRRALKLVATLGALAARRAEAERAAHAARQEEAARAAETLARLDRDGPFLAERLASSLSSHAEAWHAEIATVITGRDPSLTARDASLARYRVDRALARLATPLTLALSALASPAQVRVSELTKLVRAAVRSWAASQGAPGATPSPTATPTPSSALAVLATSAIGVLSEFLARVASAEAPKLAGAGRLRELQAFAERLAEEEAPPPEPIEPDSASLHSESP